MVKTVYFNKLTENENLNLTLQTLGFKKEFYLFKKNLRALIVRNQITNAFKLDETNDGDITIFFEDILNPGTNMGFGIKLSKKALTHFIELFNEALRNSKYILLFLFWKKQIHELVGEVNYIGEKFEKITGLDFIETIKIYYFKENQKRG